MATSDPRVVGVTTAIRPSRSAGGCLLVMASLLMILRPIPVHASPFPGSSLSGQVSAHDGHFWVGTTPVNLRGMATRLTPGGLRDARIAHWRMNVVRVGFQWSLVEPVPPVKLPDGTWVYTYDGVYLAEVVRNVQMASSRGLTVILANQRCRCTYFGYPDWEYDADYNSHGVTYSRTVEGQVQAATDFWTDPLRQRFMSSMLRYVAGHVAASPGVVGYEVLSNPDPGSLDVPAQGQLIIDVELQAAQVVRAADPARVVFFTTWGRLGVGIADPGLDLTGFEALGDVAFDVQLVSGGGLQTSQYDPRRALSTIASWLAPIGFPLMVAQFGDAVSDPNVAMFYRTITKAMNGLGVSWACRWGPWAGIVKRDGTLQPWARIVIRAAQQ